MQGRARLFRDGGCTGLRKLLYRRDLVICMTRRMKPLPCCQLPCVRCQTPKGMVNSGTRQPIHLDQSQSYKDPLKPLSIMQSTCKGEQQLKNLNTGCQSKLYGIMYSCVSKIKKLTSELKFYKLLVRNDIFFCLAVKSIIGARWYYYIFRCNLSKREKKVDISSTFC